MRLIDVRAWLSRRPEAALPATLPSARIAPAGPEAVPAAPGQGAAAGKARAALRSRLWGEGFVGPGGAEEVIRLATPLGLSAASSLLLLGCGAGGPARCVASLFGAWIEAVEADPALVAAAAAICAEAGLGKRARVAACPPGAPDFAASSAHHVLAIDPFHLAPAPVLIEAARRALRPGGLISMVATVSGPGFDPAGAEETAWMVSAEAAPPPPVASVSQGLAERGFDVRVSEDQTHAHLHQIVESWRVLVRTMRAAGERPGPIAAAVLVHEAEAWLRRARLLRAGRLRWVRWLAIARRD
ncbi:MAG: methyltransferase domain-containing protein [Rhodospirillales bacterium]|nr:methyltransferase domain-containing protein [Rhodospirillales bacterium]